MIQITRDQALNILDALERAEYVLEKHADADYCDAVGRPMGNDAHRALQMVRDEYVALNRKLEALQKREDEQMDNGNTEWSLSR